MWVVLGVMTEGEGGRENFAMVRNSRNRLLSPKRKAAYDLIDIHHLQTVSMCESGVACADAGKVDFVVER